MIECAKCGHAHPDSAIYDKTPCANCGALITAYVTDATGQKASCGEAALHAPPKKGPDSAK